MKVDVLGTEYTIYFVGKDELGECVDGDCDFYTKEIRILCIEQLLGDSKNVETKERRLREVIRHEIYHAFLFESGLSDYAYDETLVDWLALQFDKVLSCIIDVHSKIDV